MSKDRVAIVVGANGTMGMRHWQVFCDAGFNMIGGEKPISPELLSGLVVLQTSLGNEVIVSICTPDSTHADFAIAALNEGAHVICEKPLAQRLEDVHKISRARTKSGTRLSCNFPLRYDSRYAALKEKIESGKLGRIYAIDAEYNYGRLDKIASTWKGKDPDWSIINAGGCHMIDLVTFLIGSVPCNISQAVRSVSSPVGQPDFFHAFSTNEDIDVTYTFDAAYSGRHFHRLVVRGTAGMDIIETEEAEDPVAGVKAFIKSIETGNPPVIVQANICTAVASIHCSMHESSLANLAEELNEDTVRPSLH